MKKNPMVMEFTSNVDASKSIEVPISPRVKLDELTQGDENPFFMTMEVANLYGVSKNGVIYDTDLLNAICNQINNTPTEGIMGHLKEEDRSTDYKPSDIHWLGATQQDNKVFAKGYIPKTNAGVREHFRILSATGGKAATSIYGWGSYDDQPNGGTLIHDFTLEQLDLAPYTRAALQPSTKHKITAEMEKNTMEVNIVEFENLKAQIAEYQKREFAGKIGGLVKETFNWSVNTDKGKDALNALRLFVAEYTATYSKTEDEAKTIITRIAEQLKPVTELMVANLSGPVMNMANNSVNPMALVDTPENRRKALAEFGLFE